MSVRYGHTVCTALYHAVSYCHNTDNTTVLYGYFLRYPQRSHSPSTEKQKKFLIVLLRIKILILIRLILSIKFWKYLEIDPVVGFSAAFVAVGQTGAAQMIAAGKYSTA